MTRKTRKQYAIGMRDGAWHRFALVDADRFALQKGVKGSGGPNDFLRILKARATDLRRPGATTQISDGMLLRAHDYANFGGMKGGLQGRVPLRSLAVAGLVSLSAGPLFDEDDLLVRDAQSTRA